jgi:predicted Zn-dependent protease
MASALALCLGGGAAFAHGGGGAVTYLRDTEIEADLATMMTPVWRAAGLDPSEVHVYVVDDDSINSFVAGGQNEFVNSGLLLQAKTPNQLIGVLAHETGHIAGGHLSRAPEAMKNAGIEGMIAMALGAAAAALSHSPEGGGAVIGAAGVGPSAFAHYSVTIEASADQAAMTYLDRTHQSARGLLQFFEYLDGQQLLAGDRQDPYLRDHPLTEDRIEYVRDHVEHSPWSNAPDTPANIALLARVKAKLAAFTQAPAETLAKYPETDNSLVARYARAIAYYRIPQLDKALALVDGLIREQPQDPYFEELKGQMLFENGHIREAIAPYEAAVRLMPSAALLRLGLAQTLIEADDPKLNHRAIAELKDALRTEDHEPDAWHLLATAYGRDRQFGMAALALAEEGLAAGKKKTALQQASRAQQLLPKNSVDYARAAEIRREANDLDDRD